MQLVKYLDRNQSSKTLIVCITQEEASMNADDFLTLVDNLGSDCTEKRHFGGSMTVKKGLKTDRLYAFVTVYID